MTRATIFCNHYRAMSDHKTCSVGVSYDSFKGLPFESKPCFWRYGNEHPNAGCSLMEMPMPEQIAAEEAEIEKRCQELGKARRAIVEHLGGPWKRGTAGASGVIDCPVCGGEKTLRFSRAGINGHIHAGCRTENCVRWMG